MDAFFLESKDPLFGIIIFFVLIFVITFFSYWLSKYKKREDHKHLDMFLQQFQSLPSQNELKVLIAKGELSEKSWFLLANAYTKSGNYEKSIEIYSELLKVGDKANYRDTMFLLGKTYFKAGFLERAKTVFLEILKANPRTPQALNYLLLVYEQTRDYKAAMEILEPLEELGKDTVVQRAYLEALLVLHYTKLTPQQKAEELLQIYKSSHALTHLVFEYLFRVNPKSAWENFDASKAEELIDVLWSVDKKDLNLEVIMQNSYLRELYSAKGYIKVANRSSVFELDILINLDAKVNATLGFEYICNNCKVVFPFAFHRCSNCHAIDTSRAEITLVKDYHKDFSEENNSFQ
ncbi:MAG: tetratricopeptide repeat protein [Sulfurimonas sp.]|uniref:tetratricopeptide repeat protein n=1 Tax=Sulfurimonas sp. TaxID=2022749 RepID=UPI00261EFD6F|nr:tetratricopeptide repeat protein [Sulfurimonas sp.]MDD2653236.1 tetratricopeptide repeat protein [Sulfurimonas sp.]MDD3452301.1 tetratricopeptide repeat protein [Sulfurimonas sp.]